MTTIKPLSQYNAFFKLARERNLCGIDQLVGLHIQNKFNQAHWAETILLADAELLECINWYDKTGSPTSLDSIRNAKARLKKKGFIDFKPGKGNKPTEYRLTQLYPSDTLEDTPTDTPSDTELFPHIACTPKTFLDVKTSNSNSNSSAGARSDGKDSKDAEIFTGSLPLNLHENELDAIIEEWNLSSCFSKLDFELISELELLLRKHGATAIRNAMAKAKRSTDRGVSFNYFKAILEPRRKQPLKGGESNGKYDKPEYNAELERLLNTVEL